MKTKIILATATLLTLCSCTSPAEPAHSSASISSNAITSSTVSLVTSEVSAEASESVSSKPSEEKKEEVSSQKESSSSKKQSSTSSKKPSGSMSSKKPSADTSSTKGSDAPTTKKDYLDTSKLTGTKADVGKVVGYSTLFGKDIVVSKVEEGFTGSGLKYIETTYSDGTVTCVVECKYCHGFPCPKGGGKKCTKYDIKLDGQITCQQCGKPKGNGYYGTCQGLIDWNNGAKITCNYYSNCLKCRKPVGDGYNGTCHVTWGKYSGVTTCHHYD